MKGDVVFEKGGRLQRALMSHPFRQTTLLLPAYGENRKCTYTHANALHPWQRGRAERSCQVLHHTLRSEVSADTAASSC